MPTNDYYSLYSPVDRLYIYALRHNLKFIQKKNMIYIKEHKNKPQLEFVIDEGYIRTPMI